MTQTVGRIEQLTHEKPPLPDLARLSPVRSDSLLAEALTAIRFLMEELENYTAVHGEDEDDEQALALGRAVIHKANSVHHMTSLGGKP